MKGTTDMPTGKSKLNKDKCSLTCTSVLLFGEVISKHGVKPDPQMLKKIMEMPPPKTKKEFPAFLGIMNYSGKFSPNTAHIWITKTADIKQNIMGLEYNILETIWQGKNKQYQRIHV